MMAELDSSSNEERFSLLMQMQGQLRHALALGIVHVDTEIDLQASLADSLVSEFERSQRPQDLYDTIDHYEAIV